MDDTRNTHWFWTGLAGSVITAVCCFTPLLLLTLGAMGLGMVAGYADYVLLPALIFFLGMMIWSIVGRREPKRSRCCEEGAHSRPTSPSATERGHDG